MGSQSPGTTRPLSVDAQIVQLVVHRDEKGYGMKVSGDNPVYVQSVKEGRFTGYRVEVECNIMKNYRARANYLIIHT